MNDERASSSYPTSPDPAKVGRVSERRAPHGDVPAAGLSVLIGADVQTPVGWLGRICALAGASTVHTVADYAVLADRCEELGPDLILLDFDASSAGSGVLTALRERLPDQGFLPILVLEADTTPRNCARALAAGATDVVTKPFSDAELVERMSNLLTMRGLYRHVRHSNHVQRSGHETLA